MPRIESPKTYVWEGKGNRYWYRAKWAVYWKIEDHETPPKEMESGLGNVTRNTDTKSEHFNRWFGSVQIVSNRRLTVVKSDPMFTKEDAMAWVEVVERMNRG